MAQKCIGVDFNKGLRFDSIPKSSPNRKSRGFRPPQISFRIAAGSAGNANVAFVSFMADMRSHEESPLL